MRDAELEACFPKLQTFNYTITSPEDPKYNCIAFGLGCNSLIFQLYPYPSKIYYWPPQVPRDDTVENWMHVYGLHGYVACSNGDLEPGIEKIAIYVKDGEPSHVARQLNSGWWQSKLGIYGCDIEHETLESLEGDHGDEYGQVTLFMMRPDRRPSNQSA